MTKRLTIFLILLQFYGCSRPVTSIKATAPGDYAVPEAGIVSLRGDKAKTYNKLLNQLTLSNFQIDYINSTEDQIKAQYSGQSDLYVDCGIRRISTQEGAYLDSVIIYNSSPYYIYAAYRYNHLDTVTISNYFTGMLNIILTGDSTSTHVLSQISLNLETREIRTSTQYPGETDRTYELTITSNEQFFAEAFGATCRSTGKFERDILTLLSRL